MPDRPPSQRSWRVRAGRLARAVLLAGSAMTLSACETTAKPSGDPDSIESGPMLEDSVWPFWPVSMRIHPLTRLTEDPESGRPVIELRVEFNDAFGHTTKCVGEIVAELHDGMPEMDDEAVDENFWRRDLRRLNTNQTHYDEVTRTYLLRLFVEPEDLPDDPHLRVMLQSTDGRVLVATESLLR